MIRAITFWTLLVVLFVPEVKAAESDPLEGINRKVFIFNEAVDQYLWLPATKAYQAVTPDPVERGVHNVLGNLQDVISVFSNLAQLKFHNAAQDVARVVMNTTFGLFGVMDLATPFGLPKQGEDIGQALGYWGVGSGPYLMLPLLGPATVRDGLARIPDSMLHPINTVSDPDWVLTHQALYLLDLRGELMNAEKLISGDRYAFIRDAYLQRREFLVKDGQIGDSYGDDGF